MSKILKNNTGSDITLADTGNVTILANNQITIDPSEYLTFARSADLLTYLNDASPTPSITVNDGNEDLTPNDGARLIIGSYPNKNKILGSDGTEIGNSSDALKVKIDKRPDLGDLSVSPLGATRVSSSTSIFQSAHTAGKEPLYWSEDISGTGAASTYMEDEATVKIEAGLVSGNYVYRRTCRNFNYYKGQTQSINLTFSVGNYSDTGKEICYGYGDDLDGLFIGIEDGTPYINRRTSTSGSVVDNKTYQSSWNLDTLDGSSDANNPSGLQIDFTKTQLMTIELTWLGVDGYRFAFKINGTIVTVHAEYFSNSLAVPYMRQATLPISARVENTSTQTTSPYLKIICQQIHYDGAQVSEGRHRVVSTGATPVGVNATPKIVAGLRLKVVNKRLSVKPVNFSLFRVSNDDVIYWRILYKPDWTGASVSPTWADLDGICQGLTNNPTKSGGFSAEYVLSEGYIEPGTGSSSKSSASVSQDIAEDLYLGRCASDTINELVLEVRRITGSGTQDLLFTGSYLELF